MEKKDNKIISNLNKYINQNFENKKPTHQDISKIEETYQFLKDLL
jgi:hypothetical protein